MFQIITDKRKADKLWEAGLLWVANRGRNNWLLDDTHDPPSTMWQYDYAILLED